MKLTKIEQKTFPRQVVSGTGIDEVYDKNQSDLIQLQKDKNVNAIEAEQLKKLNEKLMERVEFL